MRRNAVDLSNAIKTMLGDTQPEGLESLLEDIADSTGEFSADNYVEKTEYEKIVSERDSAMLEAAELRNKYINRFYNNNNNGLDIIGGELMKKEEEVVPYADLFE